MWHSPRVRPRAERYDRPVGQIIGIGGGVVQQSAVLDDEAARVRTVPAGVPAERCAAADLPQRGNRLGDMRPLERLLDRLIVDPAQSVTGDLVGEVLVNR